MNIPTYRTSLLKKEAVAKDLLELRFEKPQNFSFTAGQFVQFQIPCEHAHVLRSYSLSSTPMDDWLECCVKILPDGKASGYFSRMAPGDTIAFQGPTGRFTAKEKSEASFFIATGAGLAPIFSIIRDMTEQKKHPHTITLLFGIRSEEDAFWTERLDALQASHANFSYRLILSQPKTKHIANALHGRVTDHLSPIDPHGHFYLCGDTAMVKDARGILLKNGVPMEHISFEIF